MVTYAKENMLPELLKLWQISFGDSPEYIQMFLDCNFSRIATVVYVIEQKPVSVAYLLPVTYKRAGLPSEECLYLYAAATLPAHRGKGYFGEILKFIHQNIKEPILLVPGEASLISYYEKQGLKVWLEEQRKELCMTAMPASCSVSDLTAKQYFKLRESILRKSQPKGYMGWDKSFIKYICLENEFCGGEMKQFSLEGQACIAMFRKEQDKLKIMELLPQKLWESGAKYLAQALQVSDGKVEVCLQPAVMVSAGWQIKEGQGYFNLTMG